MSNLSMEARIELETRDLKPKEVKELFLDNCRASSIEGLTDQFEELELLSMINLGLTSLKGFPNFPKLKSLEISDNKLTGDLEYLKGCPNIASLKICNNRIADIAALEPLKILANLTSLDLIECPIAEGDKYRETVFGALPQLTFLDGIDREGNAEPDSDEDYELDEEDEDVDSEEEGDEEEDEEEDEEDEDDEEGEEEEEKEEVTAEVEENGTENGKAEADITDEDSQPAAKRAKIDPEGHGDSNGVPDSAAVES
ncbi:hypothetical protein ACHWQZ_G012810 [Mnemiopsis leidyi]